MSKPKSRECYVCFGAGTLSLSWFLPHEGGLKVHPAGSVCPKCGGTGQLAIVPQVRSLIPVGKAVLLTDLVKERGFDLPPDPEGVPDECGYLRYAGGIPAELAKWLPHAEIGVQKDSDRREGYYRHFVFSRPALMLILDSLLPGQDNSRHVRVLSTLKKRYWKPWEKILPDAQLI